MHWSKRTVTRLSTISIAVAFFGFLCRWTLQLMADDQPESIPTAEAPVGGEYVRSIRLLTIPRATSGRAESAITCNQSVYLAGKWWNREEKSNLWLWRLDDSGEKVWEKHLAHQERNEEVTVVGLMPGVRKLTEAEPVPGVRVVYRQGLDTKLAFFQSDGERVLEKKIEGLNNTYGLVAAQEDTVFVFGSMGDVGQRSHAWVARVTRLGEVLWKRTFLAEEVSAADASRKADEAETVPAGSFRATFLFDGTMSEDGSLVLVGQTGVYNKFGQGPSKLWLLRIDGDGNRLGQAFIDGGRVFPSVRDLIAHCDGGVIASYTTDQLPPISQAPLNVPPGFGIRLVRFNGELEKLWDKQISKSAMPGRATITGPAPFVTLTTVPGELLIRGTNDAGNELWKARVATRDSFVTPLATLRRGDEIISVFNYRKHRSADSERREEVLLVSVLYTSP